MIVVDTNLVVYLFVQGKGTSRAESVLAKDGVWVVPWLWRSEFRNCVVGLIRRGEMSLEDGILLAEEAENWMEGREYTVHTAHVMELSLASHCSAYDCEFVALAEDLRIPLVTADRQVLRAFPSIAKAVDRFGV
ncbi:MAG: PIN domain-containing protein [Nitrospira sp. CR1.3]|nr:PIN domain-containing protein [Nitrospira sp. CR1.3]